MQIEQNWSWLICIDLHRSLFINIGIKSSHVHRSFLLGYWSLLIYTLLPHPNKKTAHFFRSIFGALWSLTLDSISPEKISQDHLAKCKWPWYMVWVSNTGTLQDSLDLPNANQFRSKLRYWSNADQCRSLLINAWILIGINRHWPLI